MREMPTSVGATGNNGRTEGLPEMQKPVLEHSASEACAEKEIARDSGVVKMVTKVPKLTVVRTWRHGECTGAEWSDGRVLFYVPKDASRTIKQTRTGLQSSDQAGRQ